MKKFWRVLAFGIIAVLVLGFNVYTFLLVSKKPKAPREIEVGKIPRKAYGRVEPRGGEVYVSPNVTKRVLAIHLQEGDSVRKGQRLCTLERKVEKTRLQAALARVKVQEKQAEISRDEFFRKMKLIETNTITDFEYSQIKLRKELDEVKTEMLKREAATVQALLEQLTLRSPIRGRIYKLDVKLGETLRAGDNTKIILGSDDLQVTLYVESFWINQLLPSTFYSVYDSETGESIGKGKILSRSPYLDTKKLRTEDPDERIDTRFQKVVMDLETERESVPIGLQVTVEIPSGI
ncbi:MAG: hypothetical protein SVY10_08545 [Thermodesulfobacteriota bacterium]|nr:hypothetical protein [Thermodesulfobacteriota bacterium]